MMLRHFRALCQGLDRRDWDRWPPALLVSGVMFAAALGALLVWVVAGVAASPDGSDAAQLQTQRQDLQKQVLDLQARGDSSHIKAKVSPLHEMNLVQQGWPTPDQSQQVFMALYAQAQRLGLQVDSFKPEDSQTMQGLESRSLSLRLHGRFSQVLSWSEALFQQAALWVPEKWLLTASPSGEVSLEALLHLPLRPSGATGSQLMMDNQGLSASRAKDSPSAGDPFSRSSHEMPESAQMGVVDMGLHPLRRWPLQEMQLVGTFKHGGARHALILTPAGLYQLALGERLGVEGGRVIALEEAELQVSTPVKQADGRWKPHLDVLPIRRAGLPTKEKRS
jgi:Tfp pilus assembly protein PilP